MDQHRYTALMDAAQLMMRLWECVDLDRAGALTLSRAIDYCLARAGAMIEQEVEA